MIPLTLGAYKIPIEGSALTPAADAILKAASTPQTLAEAVGWDSIPEPLTAGLAPTNNISAFKKQVAAYHQRLTLEKARLNAGFPDLVGPRKGLKGLLQKWFRDRKEPTLPIEVDLIQWLEACPRYQLLVALHDALLNKTALADPQPVSLEDIGRFSHPLAEVLTSTDPKRLQKFYTLLTTPLKKLTPTALIDEVAGYVVAFDTRSGFAYYFG